MAGTPSQTDPSHHATAAHFVHLSVHLLRIIRRRRRVFAAVLLGVFAIGGTYYALARRAYRASASLLIMPAGTDPASEKSLPEYQQQALIPTYENLVRSSVVLDGALKRLSRQRAEHRVDFTGYEPQRWADVLRSRLGTASPRRTRMVDVSYRSDSPRAAEAVLTAVVESYLAFIEDNHRDISIEIKRILDAARERVEADLVEKESELVLLRQELRDPGTEQDEELLHPVVMRAMQMNEALAETTLRRVELEALVASARETIQNGGSIGAQLLGVQPDVGRAAILSSLGAYGKDSQLIARMRADLVEHQAHLQSLGSYLGSAHPDVTALTAKVRNLQRHLDTYDSARTRSLDDEQHRHMGPALVAVAEQELGQARRHEQTLSKQYAQAEAEAIDMSGRMAEVALLEHDRELLDNLHEVLLNQSADVKITQQHTDVQVSVVTEATASDDPVSPSRAFVGILCLLLGFGGGTCLVYVLDVLDDRFRSADEAAAQLGTHLLSAIPKMLPSDATGIDALQVHVAPDDEESEAFRTLRTALALSGREAGRLVVSSAEPGDGKTTVLANLAVSFAQSGKRTLMIDGDMRRPGLTKLFDMRGREGLSHVLRGSAPERDEYTRRIQPAGIPGLDILPCGARPRDPAELLGSRQFAALIAWAETVYDQILVDSPPILAASDSTIIGRLVDGLVLVVQPEKNHRRMVLRAVEGIRALGVHLVGVAINRMGGEGRSALYGEEADDRYRSDRAGGPRGDRAELENMTVPFHPPGRSRAVEGPGYQRDASSDRATPRKVA